MRFVKSCHRILVGIFLGPHWVPGRVQKSPNAFMETLGKLMLMGFAALATYNLYVLATSGLVLQLRRWESDVWLSYDDDPVAFLLWAGIYTVAAVIPVLMIFGHFAWKRRARRSALRELTEGGGPPPIVRQWRDP